MLRRDNSLTIELRYLLIAVFPAVVFLVGDALLTKYGNSAIEIAPGVFDSVQEAASRYVFLGAFLFFSAIAITVIAITLADLGTLFDRTAFTRLMIVAAVLVTVVILVNLLTDSPRAYWFAGRKLFNSMFCVASTGDTFSEFTRISNLITAIAASLAIVGTISCLGTSEKGTHSVKELQAQFQRLRHYLLLSAAILVAGIILIYSWLHWPDFYIPNKSLYRTLAASLLLYFGVNYSLIIFSFYVPVALILSERVALLSVSQKARVITPLATLPDTLRTGFALLSPFLTAALSSMLTPLLG